MKTTVFSCAFIAIVLGSTMAFSDDQKVQIQQKFVEFGSECIKDHALTVDDLVSLKSRVFPENEKAGCFTECVFNKIGLFDGKGNLSHLTALENAKQIFEDEEELKSIAEFLTACAKVNDEDVSDGEKGCERAKLAFQCFAENYDKLGLNIEF